MLVTEGQLVFVAGAEVSHRFFVALGGEGQWVSGLHVEIQQVSAVGKDEEHAFALESKPVVEQHAFELDARLEVAGASGACFRMLLEPVVEQHAFELDSKPVVEQHAFELDARLEVSTAVGVCSRMLSELVEEQHAFGLAFV